MVVFCIYYTKLYIIRRASISAASAIVGLAHSFAPNASKRNRNPNINAVIVEPTVPDRERLFVPPVYALYSLNRDHCSLPYIEVVINNIPTVASFDREASISHMRITSLVTLNDTHKAKHSNSTPARDANGSTVSILGTVDLPVQVSSQSIDHRFHIPSDYECPVSVLFGSDFIHSLNAWVLKVTLDLFNDSVFLGSQIHKTVQINSVLHPQRQYYDVRVSYHFQKEVRIVLLSMATAAHQQKVRSP